MRSVSLLLRSLRSVYIKSIIVFCVFLLFFASQLNAQERQDNTLFYTYIGPTLGLGYNFASYKYWDTSSDNLRSTSFSGPFVDFGCSAAIFVDRFIGDLRIVYSMNFNDGKHKVFHPMFIINGKYSWEIDDVFSFAAGLGIYTETPPATSKYYVSSGFQIPLSVYINTSPESKLFFEFVPKLGYYKGSHNVPGDSLFDKRYKVSFGVNAGYLFRVGRL